MSRDRDVTGSGCYGIGITGSGSRDRGQDRDREEMTCVFVYVFERKGVAFQDDGQNGQSRLMSDGGRLRAVKQAIANRHDFYATVEKKERVSTRVRVYRWKMLCTVDAGHCEHYTYVFMYSAVQWERITVTYTKYSESYRERTIEHCTIGMGRR